MAARLRSRCTQLINYHKTWTFCGLSLRNRHLSATTVSCERVKEKITKIDTSFTNVSQKVYEGRSRQQLRRARNVLWLCSMETLVKHNQKLLAISRKLFGRYLHQKFMNATFYGQFVIGQDEATVRPIIEDYLRLGVGPILYFALEEDKSPNASLSNDPFYAANVRSFKEAIDITSRATGGIGGYIAVKPTALCSPSLWLKLTEVIRVRTSGGTDGNYHAESDLIAEIGEPGAIDLNEIEKEELGKLLTRAGDIIKHARESGVKVMIDAEQTYFQPAIQRILGVAMMKRFNTHSIWVLVTYQTYLKGAYDNISRDMDYCKRNGIKFGARIVRGAYLDYERMLANEKGYDDPTNPTFESTTAMYNRTAERVFEEITERTDGDVEVMFGTHNEATIKHLLSQMSSYDPPAGSVSFGQIYGMSDHITFHLGEVGLPVYKSMPYGPVELVTSYLGRRAVENRGVLDKVKKERQLLEEEWNRRKQK